MAPHDDLDIDLRLGRARDRRRFIEQASTQRPRLRGNLKQLGAVGPVVRPLAATSRRAFVKVVITKGTTTTQQLSYLQRAHNPPGKEPTLFGPAARATRPFVQAAQQDPHQFRVVVQVPEHPHLERTRYIELFMDQVERDLGRPLDWTAAHHYDTADPHTHIVLRGQDRAGKALYMARDYLTYGLRARASQLLTWLLGPVRQQQQVIQAERQTRNGVLRGLDDPDAHRLPPGQTARRAPAPRQDRNPMAGRALGYDGPDDVRIPREIGPAAGNLSALLVEAQNALAEARAYGASPAEMQTLRQDVAELQTAVQGQARTPASRPQEQGPAPGSSRDLPAQLETLRQALQQQSEAQRLKLRRGWGHGR